MHSIESRCAKGPENICSQAGPCIFQAGNFTGSSSEGVKHHLVVPDLFFSLSFLLLFLAQSSSVDHRLWPVVRLSSCRLHSTTFLPEWALNVK